MPMAAEMPDIFVSHVQSPTKSSRLGAKGAGEAGTAGGHGTMAAGHLPLGTRDPEELSRELSQQVLFDLGVRAEGKPLLDGSE